MANGRDRAAAGIIAAGLAIGGLFVGSGFARMRTSDRYVTVKGISERQVKADLAIWPLHLVAADNDLSKAHAQLESSIARIKTFVASYQLDSSQAELQDFSVTDAATNQYSSAERAASRYVIKQTVVIRSLKPDLVRTASQHVGELVSAGVVLSSGGEYGSGGPTFVFTGLNELKPKMIGEATARARESAEQFERDSHIDLSGIKTAYQGIFEILPRDQAQGISEESQIMKTVRVVSTIEYALKN
jgi:hypothetical protein